jgi:hypothetical protein
VPPRYRLLPPRRVAASLLQLFSVISMILAAERICAPPPALSIAHETGAGVLPIIPSQNRVRRRRLQGRDDLRPDGDHAKEQRERGESNGFFR